MGDLKRVAPLETRRWAGVSGWAVDAETHSVTVAPREISSDRHNVADRRSAKWRIRSGDAGGVP